MRRLVLVATAAAGIAGGVLFGAREHVRPAAAASDVVTVTSGLPAKLDIGLLNEEMIAAGLMDRGSEHFVRKTAAGIECMVKTGTTLQQVRAVLAAHDGKDVVERTIDLLQEADDSWGTLTNAQKDQVLRRLVKVVVARARRDG